MSEQSILIRTERGIAGLHRVVLAIGGFVLLVFHVAALIWTEFEHLVRMRNILL
jgi:hypothetical protein